MKRVEILNQRVVFDDVFKIEEATLRFERFNGQMSEPVRRLVFERGDAAAALLWNRDTQKVILIKQSRYPTSNRSPRSMFHQEADLNALRSTTQKSVRRTGLPREADVLLSTKILS